MLDAFGRVDAVWDKLFPADQMRILGLLVDGVDVAPDRIDVRLRLGGIHGLLGELLAGDSVEKAAGNRRTST